MNEFFRTPMGRRFFESTMPGLVEQLERLNANLERLIAVVGHDPPPVAPTSDEPREERR